MVRTGLARFAVAASVVALGAISVAAAPAQETAAGWSVDLSKPKQAIMSYSPEANSPRLPTRPTSTRARSASCAAN
jgi:hypothetical protein